MRNCKLFVLSMLGTVLAAWLSGCIISASPGTGSTIDVNAGDTIVLKVNGVNLNSPVSKCVWEIDRRNGDYVSEILVGKDQLDYTIDPDGENSNRITITCVLYNWEVHVGSVGNPGIHCGWYAKDGRVWNIRILRDTQPVWHGNYHVKDDSDLQLLSGYSRVTGSLSVVSTKLKSLECLAGLTRVDKDIDIYSNYSLTNLSGMRNITSVGGNLDIAGNSLTSLSGLESLEAVGGDLDICEDGLTSLSSLENLDTVGGDLDIRDNDSLINLAGLENLTSVGGALYIWENYALTSLTGLENLTSIVNALNIYDNPALTSLIGLENLVSIGGYLSIYENPALTALGMAGLHKVCGYFDIVYNPLLCTSLAEGLKEQVLSREGIGGSVWIGSNKDC